MRINDLTSPALERLLARRPVALPTRLDMPRLEVVVDDRQPPEPLLQHRGVHTSHDRLQCRCVDPHRTREAGAVARHAERELREAAAESGALYLDLVRRANAQRLTEEFRRGSCHAGRYETSLVLARRPDLVDADVAQRLPAVEVDMPAAMTAGHDDFRAMGMDRAYCGAPAEATAAEGEKTFAILTRLLVELVREQTRAT